ncbi:MAG: hypothetical protein WA821_06355, partial [Anaerolineales bacterium]
MQTPPDLYHFPAILIAGTPDCGKSVLSFMLTQHLRQLEIAHYLLRAAPDGEGDWFLRGDPGVTRILRAQNKTGYTAEFVAHIKSVIEKRLVPLLVDVGGLPRGEQFDLIRACTHAVLLYKDDEGRAAWQEILREQGVPLIAELRSSLDEPGQISRTVPCLQGTISGLDRQNPLPDLTFGALFERIAGLCRYEALELEQIHLRYAQYAPVVERLLMAQIDPARQSTAPQWKPEDLEKAAALLPAGKPVSIYGRGPVWLAAMIGARTNGAPLTMYDVRYGWLPLPAVEPTLDAPSLLTKITERQDSVWVEVSLPGGVLEPGVLRCAPVPGSQGVVLSGK